MGCSANYCYDKNYYKFNQENLELGRLDEPLSPEETVPIIDESIDENGEPKKNLNNFPNLNETTVKTQEKYNEWTQLKKTTVNTPKKYNEWTQTENNFKLDESEDDIQEENNHKSVEKIERSIQTENNHHDSENESEENQDRPQFLSKKRKNP